MEKPKEWIHKNILMLIGVIVGAASGYFYWLYIGCTSGTCPITSSPIISAIWGAVLGGLILSLFQKKGNKDK
ncbi:DUF6132 family protein [uncultured Bacteroides sp.]|uniref:DUF6132 family protein n=1 Tax=uncultured Bacteroides sp. TaxID=162156 RepID=UPI002AA90C30|nr:DUF6132 family protein [uncultured Bacteroides sp.]